MKKIFLGALIVLTVFSTYADTETVQVWSSDVVKNNMLKQQPNISFSAEVKPADYEINIDASKKYQQMDGFGASLTEASCYLIDNLNSTKREEVINDLFGREGLNLSILRQPIGGSDFNKTAWTYNDTEKNKDDFNLENFSLANEEAYIRPILDQAYSVKPGQIKIIGSPWSPPAWMKTGKHLFGKAGGKLRTDCYNVYADYFIKYIKEYEKKGTPLYAITIQNEPLYAPKYYPGMIMTPEEQIAFIKILGPKFRENNIETKIICYDHNFDHGLEYASTVLKDHTAYEYCAGTGFHPYCWPMIHDQMSLLHDEFPEKDIWLTEAGSGLWIGDNTTQFQDQVYHTIRTPRNWGKAVIFWNIALDQNAGPKLKNVDTDNANRGILEIRSDVKDSVTKGLQYYSMAHTSKFVETGAYRIASNTFEWEMEDVAYLNPDNSTVVVLLNRADKEKSVKINYNSKHLYLTMKPKEAVTLKW